MKKTFLLLWLFPVLAFSQLTVTGGSSLDLDELLPIITDSTDWTAGSTVHAIKPKGAKTVEADSVKAGALEVTGNARFNGNVTLVTTASESLIVSAGGIRNEGGLLQKGLSQFGATATPVYITADGKVGIGTATSSPYNAFGLVSSTSGRGTGIGLTSAKWNKKRTDWVTASDTSAIGMYIDSAGAPRLSMKAVDGDSVGMWLDGTNFSIKHVAGSIYSDAKIEHGWQINGNYMVFLTTGALYPNVNDIYNLGSTSKRYQNIWGSDYYWLGGKGQTATQYISQENTIAGQDSSMKLWIDGGNPKIDMKSGYAGQNIRQQYFGPDTLALFNGARTGRDSTVYVLPNGNVGTNGMVTIKRAVSLADQAEYTPQIPSGMCGWGSVQIGDDVEWARFRFKTDGTVTLEANSTNVGTTNDVDAKLNIYDAGTSGIIIENQLGSTLTAAMVIECYTP